MSAALQLPLALPPSLTVRKVWATVDTTQHKPVQQAAQVIRYLREHAPKPAVNSTVHPQAEPDVCYAFYRKHTESLLRRYLCASTQIGRSPSLLGASVGRGWVSSRRVRTFEDAVIFVLDVERCMAKLTLVDRQLITRIAIQEYTQAEAATHMGISVRTVSNKFPQALDRLTQLLTESELLVLPE